MQNFKSNSREKKFMKKSVKKSTAAKKIVKPKKSSNGLKSASSMKTASKKTIQTKSANIKKLKPSPMQAPQVFDTAGGVMPDASQRQGPTPKEVNDRFSPRHEFRHQSR
jgi:hypothetical protein